MATHGRRAAAGRRAGSTTNTSSSSGGWAGDSKNSDSPASSAPAPSAVPAPRQGGWGGNSDNTSNSDSNKPVTRSGGWGEDKNTNSNNSNDDNQIGSKSGNNKSISTGWGGSDSTSSSSSSMSAKPKPTGWGKPSTSSADGPVRHGRRTGRDNAASSSGSGDKYDAADMIANLEEIPDLEEAQEEDITLKVANAPNVRSNRIQGLQELDHEIMFQLPTSTADGIDVSYLTSSLATQESVAEPDKPWDFDSLFTEVASFMQAELEGEDEKMEINK